MVYTHILRKWYPILCDWVQWFTTWIPFKGGGVTFIFNSPKLKSFSVKNCGICFCVLCCFIFSRKNYFLCLPGKHNIFSCGAHFISAQDVVLYSFHKYNMLCYVLGLVLSCGVCVWSCGLWCWSCVSCGLSVLCGVVLWSYKWPTHNSLNTRQFSSAKWVFYRPLYMYLIYLL